VPLFWQKKGVLGETIILKINGGDEGSRLDLFALNVSSLEGLNKKYFSILQAPHSAHRSPNPQKCVLRNTHHTNKEDRINLPSLLVETRGVEPLSKTD